VCVRERGVCVCVRREHWSIDGFLANYDGDRVRRVKRESERANGT